MNSRELRQKWNNQVEIVQRTFKKYNLVVRSYGFKDFEDDGTMTLLLEIELLDDMKEDYVFVKANFYDKNGVILYTVDEEIDDEYFSGYDTVEIHLYEDNLAYEATRCRVYATRE